MRCACTCLDERVPSKCGVNKKKKKNELTAQNAMNAVIFPSVVVTPIGTTQ